jgi:hypothetical protein
VSVSQRRAARLPELDRLRAPLCTLRPYRVAAGVLGDLLPVDAELDPETLRARTLRIGADLVDLAAAKPAAAAPAITLTLAATFLRSGEEGSRPLEVGLGNVETSAGARLDYFAVQPLYWSMLSRVTRCDGIKITSCAGGLPCRIS